MKAFKVLMSTLVLAVLAAGLWLIIFGAPVDDSVLKQHMQEFNEQDFARAQNNGELILINFHRGWCPNCQQQKRVLARYFIDFPQSEIRVFEIDFNDNPDLVTRFRAQDATTLLLYRGNSRIWYNHNLTNTATIYSALQKAEYETRVSRQ